MPIFDQGYQHWSGELTGHAWRWLAITRHGVRASMKLRTVRMILLAAWSPALALVAMVSIWGLLERNSEIIKPIIQMLSFLGNRVIAEPRAYRVDVWTLSYEIFLGIELWFSMILILLIGPNLISMDLRFNALPLYFSRPLRRIDYFIGKLGIIATFLAMVVVLPSIVAWILGLAFSLDITIVRDTYRLLFSSIAYGLIVTLSAGLLVLALSSLSRNSRYIALFWLGIWFVSGIVGMALMEAGSDQRRRDHYRAQGSGIYTQPYRRAGRDYFAAELEASKTDWRPLVSYTSNLRRIGQELLGSQRAWQTFARMRPVTDQDRFLVNNAGPNYPWQWSACVLGGLFVVSALILNFRVKSLDRLK